MPQGLFAGTDGRLFKNLIFTRHQLTDPFSLNALNQLQGMGAQSMPMNVWLHPAYIPFLFFSEKTAVLVSAVISLLALTASAYFLARKLGMDSPSAVFAAQISTVVFFPFQHEYDLLINYLLNPGFAVSTALVIISLGCFVTLNDYYPNRRPGILSLVFLLAMVVLAVFLDPIGVVASYVYFSPLFVAVTVTASIRSKKFVLYATVLLFVFFYFSGIFQYISTLANYTGRAFAPAEVWGHPPSPRLISAILLEKSRPLYFFLGIGFIFCAIFANLRMRFLAYCAAGYFFLFFVMGVVFVVADSWIFPVPAYVELAVMPVFFIIAGLGWFLFAGELFIAGRKFLDWSGILRVLSPHTERYQFSVNAVGAIKSAITLVVVFSIPAMVLYYGFFVMSDRRDIYKEREDVVHTSKGLLARLQKYAIDPEGNFSGYAYVSQLAEQKAIPKVVHENSITSIALWNELWREKIPTINEYGLISPYSHFFFSRVSGQNNDGLPNTLPIYELSENIMALLGVSVFIDNTLRKFSGYELSGRYDSGYGHKNLYLYERKNDFSLISPTVWNYKGSLKEIYDEIQSPAFDYRNKVLVQEPLDDKLEPASSSKMKIIRGGYHITAESKSKSLIILPIQYSNCLTISGVYKTPPRLFRANGLQTGMIFQGAIAVDLKSSLAVLSAGCRKRDLDDLRFAVKGLPQRLVPKKESNASINLIEASNLIRKFWQDTSLADWLSRQRAGFSVIPAYNFTSLKPACQPFASGSNRYTGNPYLENYGPINAISENAETWFQVPAQKKLQLDMSESFLGFGWRSIERFNKISYRRLAFGHNEGLVLLRLEKGARYKLRLSYWKDMPQNIASKLSVSFNGVKLSPRLSDDGDLGFMDFVLDEQLTGVCNGWIEVMVSTAGNASRPQSGRRNKWSGLYFLLQNISILREIEQR